MTQLLQAQPNSTQTNGGYVLLLSVLVVVVIGTAVATSLLLSSVSDASSSRALQQSERARSMANTCAEEALSQLQIDDTYPAGTILTVDADSCTIEEITGSGSTNRIVRASGTAGNVVRRVEVTVDTVGPPVSISSWQEVADF